MTEDLDVEAMLEAPYMYKKEEAAPENGDKAKEVVVPEEEAPAPKKKEERRRSRSRSKGRKRSRSKSRERHRDRKDRDKGRDKDRERGRDSHRDRERDRGDRDHDRERGDRRDRDGDRKDRDGDRKDRDRERERRRSPVRRRSRSRERYGGYRGGDRRGGGGGYRGGRGYRDREEDNYRSKRSRSKERNKDKEISPVRDDPDADTRDARTVFVMQLSQRAKERELKEFFSSVGKVRTVKIITDRNSRRSKGVGYVEYDVADSVPLALGLNNQKLLGVPIIVQPSHAEKNRSAGQNVTLQKVNSGPMRLYVGSLHYNITEAMLRGIFEPFGKIDNIQLMMDTDANRSKGYGFITFHDAEDAKRALDQLNGFELAGRPMKVNHVTERNEQGQQAPSFLDSEELDKRGITLNTTGRLQLMAKLAEGTGFQIPAAAAEALHPLSQVPGLGLPGLQGLQIIPNQPITLPPATMNLQESLQAAQLQAHHSAQALAAATASAAQTNLALGMGSIPDVLSGIPPLGPGLLPEPPQVQPQQVAQAPVAQAPAPAAAGPGPTGAGSTACFMLSNMFDPQAETMLGWETDIRDDVIEECNKHGGVLHIHVDKASPQGNVYVKCPTAQIAMAALNNLHNRWFAGKMITAAYMPVANYHAIFPQAASATMLLQPSTPRRV
eukprot:XP_001198098.2 PREDICTED: RNA-binding protein 39 [Strongylocentrotus purpuratus]